MAIKIKDLEFEISDGKVTLTKGDKEIKSAVIPPTVLGRPVVKIGKNAFRWCYNLKEVSIPDSVTCIDEEAFFGCSSLLELSIPKSVTDIGDWAFFGCRKLTEIVIPDSITSINNRVFFSCGGLKKVTIPDSVTSIGYNAFYACNSLTSITVPKSVTKIGSSAFSDCEKLTSISVSESNEHYCSVDGVLYDKGRTKLICYPSGKTTDSFTVPMGVACIGYYSFSRCNKLKSLTFPNSVKTLEKLAIYDCQNLESITVPSSIELIGEHAIGYYYKEGEYNLTKNITIYGDFDSVACKYANENGVKFALIGAPKPLEYLKYEISEGKAIITGCDENVSGVLVIPSEIENYPVVKIGEGAFAYCNALTGVRISPGVEEIELCAFLECPSLKSITVPDSVKEIGVYAFGYEYADDEFKLMNDITLHGGKASATSEYADENGIKFVAD